MASKQGKVSFETSRTPQPPKTQKPASSARISETSKLSQPIEGSRISQNPKMTRKKQGFTMPALSVPPKHPPVDPALERLKKKTIRRNAPEGEDVKKIKEIIKGLNKEVVTVQEFVGLVAPYTGDNGNVLRAIMGEDLSSFRKIVKKVYDTMTQDVSDVLTNEQINLMEYYQEREKLHVDKTMRALNMILQLAPEFDFSYYSDDPEEYLKHLFPIAKSGEDLTPEEEELERRQEAYHRLQWLRSEGVRLNEENSRLQTRLKELKKEQQAQQMDVRKREELAEAHKTQLEATQTQLEDHLQILNESFEKSIISNEEECRLREDGEEMKREDEIKLSIKRSKAKRPPQEAWNLKAAREIERITHEKTEESTIAGVSMLTVATGKGTGAIKKVVKSKLKKPRRAPRKQQGDDPSHYSPPRPKSQQKQQVSPFHYSPPKSPPQGQTSPFHYSPPREPMPYQSPQSEARGGPPPTPKIRVQSTTTIIEEQGPQKRILPGVRRNLAPKDTWGGFY